MKEEGCYLSALLLGFLKASDAPWTFKSNQLGSSSVWGVIHTHTHTSNVNVSQMKPVYFSLSAVYPFSQRPAEVDSFLLLPCDKFLDLGLYREIFLMGGNLTDHDCFTGTGKWSAVSRE